MGTASGLIPAQHQPDAVLTQVNPVQNTWYTILDTTTNATVYRISVQVQTTNETLEVRTTIDGNTLLAAAFAATAGTIYYFIPAGLTGQVYTLSASIYSPMSYPALMGRSIKVEMRKTTAAGNGNLLGRVIYGRWP